MIQETLLDITGNNLISTGRSKQDLSEIKKRFAELLLIPGGSKYESFCALIPQRNRPLGIFLCQSPIEVIDVLDFISIKRLKHHMVIGESLNLNQSYLRNSFIVFVPSYSIFNKATKIKMTQTIF